MSRRRQRRSDPIVEAFEATYEQFSNFVSEVAPRVTLAAISECPQGMSSLIVPVTSGRLDDRQMDAIRKFPCNWTHDHGPRTDLKRMEFSVPLMVKRSGWSAGRSRMCCCSKTGLVLLFVLLLVALYAAARYSTPEATYQWLKGE